MADHVDAPQDGPSVDETSETNALARLSRKQKELDNVKGEYNDALAKRDEEIEQKDAELKDLKTERGRLNREQTQMRAEVENLKEKLKTSEQAKKKVADELTMQKKLSDMDRNQNLNTAKTLENAKQTTQNIRKELDKAQAQTAGEQATNKQLHKQLDDAKEWAASLTQDMEVVMAEREQMHQDITSANEELEETFKELAVGHSLPQNVKQLKDLKASGRLKRQDSFTSLGKRSSNASSSSQANLRNVSGQSLDNELKDTGIDDSSTESGDDDDEPTLTGTGIPTAPEQFTLMQYPGVEIEPVPQPTEPPVQVKHSGVQTSPVTGPNENLIQVSYPGVETAPVAPTPEKYVLVHYPGVETSPIAPSIALPAKSSKAGSGRPSIAMILGALLLALIYVHTMFGALAERKMWLAANDVSRQRVASWGAGTGSSVVDSLFVPMQDWLGLEFVAFG